MNPRIYRLFLADRPYDQHEEATTSMSYTMQASRFVSPAEAVEAAPKGEESTTPGQFAPDGLWICTEDCRRELAIKRSYDDLAESGGIVDAP